MADVDSVIESCVNDIWSEYDKDNSGALDKEECKTFVLNTIQEFSGRETMEDYTLENFEETFSEFDIDGNGTIDKGEMVRFIRRVAGLSGGKR